MLKFTQKAGKTIRIDDEIKITVLEAIGKQVTLGIEAPNHVKIYRAELYLQNADKQGNNPK
ncbi:carbon storage regulator [Pseudomonas allokribbensis]|uniref:carbon storage regulator n=1 Tax=Pseudomonas allokribbensis TaxID=2774460 RepID=UPI0017882DAA|nr:carbon storage regulator [Pseudomonas allokribbensis]